MKKFNPILEFRMIALLLLVISFTVGCQKNNSLTNLANDKKVLVFLPGSTAGFDASSPAGMNDLVVTLAREKGEIKILEAGIKEFRDNLGLFKAVSAVYKIGDEVTRMVVPLSESEVTAKDSQEETLMLADQGCEMKCTSAWGCSSYKQTIIERCKSQTCECTGGSGGCSSKIIFLPPPSQN